MRKPMAQHAKLVMWHMYGGKSCVHCGHKYTDPADMVNRDAVRANRPPGSVEIACKVCFDLHGALGHD